MNEENVSYYAVIPANVRYDSELPPNAKLLYGEITALSNKKGYCYASNSYFSNLYKVSVRSITGWITKLADRGYIQIEMKYREGSKLIEERRITINQNPETYRKKVPEGIENNFHTYRKNFPEGMEKNFYDNNTSINNTINNKNNIILSDFEILWALYPNKKGKSAAYKAYERAVKKGVNFEVVEKGIRSFVADCQKNNTQKKYIPYGSTWFNQERWNDDYDNSGSLPTYEGGENILDELEGII